MNVRIVHLSLLLLLLLASAAPSLAVTGPWQENEPSRVRLVSPWEQAPRAGELRLGLEFEIIPGWHVYWKNSGDAGFPPAIDFSPTAAVVASELLYPAPERFDLRGGLVAFGYQRHVIYPLRVELAEVFGEVLALAADLDYLVCEVDCIPFSYRLTLDQPLAAPGEPPVAGPEAQAIERWWERLPISLDADSAVLPEVTTQGRMEMEDLAAPRLIVDLRGVTAGRGGGGTEPHLFLDPHEVFDTGRPKWQPTADGLRFAVPLSFREVPEAAPDEARFAWTVTNLRLPTQTASETSFAIEARRTVGATAGEPEPGTAPGGADELAGPLQNPVLLALLALVTLALAFAAWGLLPTGRAKAGPDERSRLREAAGFAALAGLLWILYLLSRRIASEQVALIELLLLALGLVAWARGVVRRRWAVWLLTLLLLAGAGCVLWLAG